MSIGCYCIGLTRIPIALIIFLATAFHILFTPLKAVASPAKGQSESEARQSTHFIVSIDVSGDMRRVVMGPQKVAAKAIASLLFDGVPDSVSRPRFNPATDEVSVITFVLTEARANECKASTGFTASPEKLFSLQPVVSGGRSAFEESLARALARECTIPTGMNYAPVVTAEMMAPVFAGKQQWDRNQDQRLFDHTVLITVSNDVYNGFPTRELDDLTRRRGLPLDGVEDALALTRQVAQNFHMVSPEGWLISAIMRDNHFVGLKAGVQSSSDGPPLRLQMIRLEPAGVNLAGAVDIPARLVLDRVAIGPNRLQFEPAAGERADIRVPLRSGSDLPRLIPLKAELRTRTTNRQPWRIGSKALAATATIDLVGCPHPACSRAGDDLRINPLAALGAPDGLGAADSLPADGDIEIRLSFRHYTGALYNALGVKTEWLTLPVGFAPPLKVEGSTWAPANLYLDNATLAGVWRPGDRDLTQSVARVRLLAERDRQEMVRTAQGLALAILMPVVLIALCFAVCYRRPFRPRLIWSPATNPTLDFDDAGNNRLLLGTVTVTNTASVPWFGRLLANHDHPHRPATLSLALPALTTYRLRVSDDKAIGFLSDETGQPLSQIVEREITHGNQFPLFLAVERVLDYEGDCEGDDAEEAIPLTVALSWRRRWKDARGTREEEVGLRLRLRRERPRLPLVKIELPDDAAPPLTFERGQTRVIGTVVIESQARHAFAQRFAASYAIIARRAGIPLADGALRLAGDTAGIEIPSGATIRRDLLLECDGCLVPNPELSEDIYGFRLVGDAAPHSDLGPHGFALRRDPTLCEPRLMLDWCGRQYDIAWPNGGTEARVGTATVDSLSSMPVSPLPGNVLSLPDPPEGARILILASGGTAEVLRLRLGNTGHSGRGLVTFSWTWSLSEDETNPAIEPQPGKRLNDLITVADDITSLPVQGTSLVIPEGLDTERALHIAALGRAIKRIHGDRSGALSLRLMLTVSRTNDRGDVWSGTLSVAGRFHLEALPPPNWLCIDFGTSAIAAALGAGDVVGLIDLQRRLPQTDAQAARLERNLADYDPTNPERGSPFLPSYVVCDADTRSGPAKKHARPGFPAFVPGSLKPEDPAFLSLPATASAWHRHPRRVIGSLKSWLGRSSASIVLGEDVPHEADGGDVIEGPLPTDRVVEGAFAALASAYLDDPLHRAGRVIVTHPNTFSPVHRDRLRRCVLQGLGPHLNIHLPERVQLIGESDAIAFHHCRNRQRQEQKPRHRERILVFDLGAGTLDLTLLDVRWSRGEVVRPEAWTVENRIGVPVAGNHLDRILAWLVDRELKTLAKAHGADINYVFPAVAASLGGAGDRKDDHRQAIAELAVALRRAKQGDRERDLPPWDGRSPFLVQVGGDGPFLMNVKNDQVRKSLPESPNGGSPQLITRDDAILLAFPAEAVHGDRGVRAFLRFLTKTCVTELLDGAGRSHGDVDTVLVSGRGALWPGLRDAVVKQFPKAETPMLHASSDMMKDAVVRGAIAWQQLTGAARTVIEQRQPRLAVLLEGENRLVEEKDWKHPIDLSANASFRLIQIECANPDMRRDARTLRRHFYIDVGFGSLQREEFCQSDPHLRIHRERDRAGYTAIRVEGSSASRTLGVSGVAGSVVMRPPWPVGEPLLSPDEPPEEE